jgi:hypothetical protein
MCVPETANGNTREGVEIAPPVRIPEPNAFAALEGNGQAAIGGHQGFAHHGRPQSVSKKTKKAVPREGKPPLLKGEASEYIAKPA